VYMSKSKRFANSSSFNGTISGEICSLISLTSIAVKESHLVRFLNFFSSLRAINGPQLGRLMLLVFPLKPACLYLHS
jgi:hypothetical protein